MEGRTTIQVEEKLRKELKVLAASRDLSYQELLADMIRVFKEINPEKTVVSIPTQLAAKVQKKIPTTDFSSTSEYITYLLRQLLADTYDKTMIGQEDEQRVKAKLQALGYLG